MEKIYKSSFVFILRIIFYLFSLNNLVAQQTDLVIQMGHSGSVNSVDFSPDGRYVITGSSDKTAKLWDVNTGLEVRTFKGHNNAINSIVFCPDGEHIITGSDDNTAKLWEVIDGREIRSYTVDKYDGVNSISISYDGRFVAIGSRNPTIRDIQTGEIIHTLEGDLSTFSMCFDKEGKHLVRSGWSHSADLFDLSDGRLLFRLNGHQERVNGVTICSDGKFVLTGSDDETVRLWDTDSGKELKSFNGFSSDVLSVAFSLDQRFIVAGSKDGSIKILDPKTGTEVLTIPGEGHAVKSVKFSPDGKLILDGRDDGTARLYDVVSGKEVRIFRGYIKRVNSIAISPDGINLLVGGFEDQAKLFDLSIGKLINTFEEGSFIDDVAFSSDGKQMLTGSLMSVTLWDFNKGSRIRSFSLRESLFDSVYNFITGEYARTSVAFSPDNRFILFNSGPAMVQLWNIQTFQRVFVIKNDGSFFIKSSFFSPDNKYILLVLSNSVSLFEVNSGKFIRSIRGPADRINSASFSPDGRKLVLGADDNIIALYDIETGKVIKELNHGYLKDINSVSFNPDGRYVVSGSSDDTVKVWDVESGKNIRTFIGHSNSVETVKFHPNGKWVLSGSADGSVRIWDFDTGNPVAILIGPEQSDYIVSVKGNYYMSSKGALRSLAFRIGNQIFPFEQFDLKYNRPDIVIHELGHADLSLEKYYMNRYLSRLSKMGINEKDLSEEMNHPVVHVDWNVIPTLTDQKQIKLGFNAWDQKYSLEKLNIFINDVPINEITGFKIKGRKKIKIDSMPIELSDGLNRIQISVYNKKGVESNKETGYISYNGIAKKPDLYIIAVGVSNYQQSIYNLGFAAKDASDIVSFFKTFEGKQFGNIHILSLINEDAIAGNIIGAKEFFKKSSIDDLVLLFLAGHGIIDSKYNFFFGTYDVDFAHPSEAGLAYDGIENIFNGVPSRNRIILIDACFSGEIDTTEMQLVSSDIKSDVFGSVKKRSIVSKRGFLTKRNQFENLFSLQKDLFADLRQGTGAVVISSSSGDEFSYEGKQWENGVFTYSILEGMAQNEADLNGDLQVQVSELQSYVLKRVNDLTHGAQHPTVRQENLNNNFLISDFLSLRKMPAFRAHVKKGSVGVSSIDISSDSKFLLTGGKDGSVKLWHIQDKKMIRTFQGHSEGSTFIHFIPNSPHIISGGSDGFVKIWDIESGKILSYYKLYKNGIQIMDIRPDGKYIATVGLTLNIQDHDAGNVVKFWDARTGEFKCSFLSNSGMINSLSYSPDGKLVLAGSENGTIQIWDINTQKIIQTYKGHSDQIWSVAFSPDGKHIITGSQDKTAKLWETFTGKPVSTFQGDGGVVQAVSFSSNGKYAMVGYGGSDQTVKVWDISSKQIVHVLREHKNGIRSIITSKDEKYIVTGSYDGTVRLWDTNFMDE